MLSFANSFVLAISVTGSPRIWVFASPGHPVQLATKRVAQSSSLSSQNVGDEVGARAVGPSVGSGPIEGSMEGSALGTLVSSSDGLPPVPVHVPLTTHTEICVTRKLERKIPQLALPHPFSPLVKPQQQHVNTTFCPSVIKIVLNQSSTYQLKDVNLAGEKAPCSKDNCDKNQPFVFNLSSTPTKSAPSVKRFMILRMSCI